MSIIHESPLNIEQIEKNFAEINPPLRENQRNFMKNNKFAIATKPAIFPKIQLLSNVQFVYELHLANLGVHALAPNSILLEDFRSLRFGGRL